MSDDGVAYTYQNISFGFVPSRDGVEYTYVNVGLFGGTSFVGRVVGYAGPLLMIVAYTYVNQLEQIAGATRLLETGTARLLEDGTTERTLE